MANPASTSPIWPCSGVRSAVTSPTTHQVGGTSSSSAVSAPAPAASSASAWRIATVAALRLPWGEAEASEAYPARTTAASGSEPSTVTQRAVGRISPCTARTAAALPVPGSPSTTVLRAADAAVRSALAAVRQARDSPASPASGRSRPGPGLGSALLRAGAGGAGSTRCRGSSRPARRRLLRLGTTSMTTPTGRPVGTGVISRRAGPSASSTRSCHGRAPVPTSIARIVTWSWSPAGRARAARLAMTMSSVTASTGPRARAHTSRGTPP